MRLELFIFIGYVDNCKGYICLSKSSRFYSSRHVIFYELKFPYKIAFLTNSTISANASTTLLPSIPIVNSHAPLANASSHAPTSIPIVFAATNAYRFPMAHGPSHGDSPPSSPIHEAASPHTVAKSPVQTHILIYNLHLQSLKVLLLPQLLV